MAAAALHVVPRRQAECLPLLPRPPRPGRARRPRGLLLGGGARRDAHAHLCRPARRGQPVCQRAQEPGREARRPRRHLHGNGAGAAGGDAGLRSHRRAARGRVRRVLVGLAGRTAGGHRRAAPDHAGRGLAQGLGDPAEGDRRRSRRAGAQRPGHAGAAAHGSGRDHAGGPRPLVARRRRSAAGGASGRAGRGGAHTVLPAHIRHHRQAEGGRSHHGRLPHLRLRHAPLGVRHPGW